MRSILLIVTLTGCLSSVESDFVRTRAAPVGAPRAAHAVEVFLVERPTRPFKEVGLVEVRGGSSARELMTEMRARAGKEGCSAVVFLGDNDHVASASTTSTDTSTTSAPEGGTTTRTSTSVKSSSALQDGYRGVCLVYTVPRSARTL